jgi:hypothetical protein
MTEAIRGEDMGSVTEVNNPVGTSWLRFTFVLNDEVIAIPSEELVQCKGDEPQLGDCFMAGVNYVAESADNVKPRILRFVRNLGDI